MNVSYTYIDDKAIIFDENGNQVQVEYYDNLDEVLVQENIVETIENRINKLSNIQILPKKRFIPLITKSLWIRIFNKTISWRKTKIRKFKKRKIKNKRRF